MCRTRDYPARDDISSCLRHHQLAIEHASFGLSNQNVVTSFRALVAYAVQVLAFLRLLSLDSVPCVHPCVCGIIATREPAMRFSQLALLPRLATRNSCSLFSASACSRKRKLNAAKMLAKRVQVVCTQETHTTLGEDQVAFANTDFAARRKPSGAGGGLPTIFDHEWLDGRSFTAESVIPGRCLRTIVWDEEKPCISIFNIHLEGPQHSLPEKLEQLHVIAKEVESDPCDFVVFLGDFNFEFGVEALVVEPRLSDRLPLPVSPVSSSNIDPALFQYQCPCVRHGRIEPLSLLVDRILAKIAASRSRLLEARALQETVVASK